jgi:hypothetical protein
MRVAIRDHRGLYAGTWDGNQIVCDREQIGEGETFELVMLDPPDPPKPEPPKPEPPATTYPPYRPAYVGREQDWFSILVFGKPFGQKTLLDLEPTLNANGWLLTPPNAAGDRTKVHYPDGPWVRVGFGEGHWVWVVQE